MKRIRPAYEEALAARRARLRETAPGGSEMLWQARWFSGACGREFRTSDGREACVLDFGEWNREAGPDFVRAAVRIAGRERRGSIEVDLEASGWEDHGHATNPGYEDTVLHVIVRRPRRESFSRTATHREVPRVCLEDHPAGEPEWTGEAPQRPGRCVGPLRQLSPDALLDLLAVAADRRLEGKGAILQAMARARGWDQALWETVAIALGYKNNKLPFQLLAQRVSPREAATDRGEALLFGLAGFLENKTPPPGAARRTAAALWSAWWKLRAGCERAILPREAWRFAGLRPANHPVRRVAALAAIARRWKAVRAALESADPARMESVLGSLEHPFWSFHTTWNSERLASPLALLGAERIRDIHANVALPLARAGGRLPEWRALPAGPGNAPLRVVAARLFGGELPADLPRKLYIQQGLLQIHRDFCLRDHGECARCGFPALVGRLAP